MTMFKTLGSLYTSFKQLQPYAGKIIDAVQEKVVSDAMCDPNSHSWSSRLGTVETCRHGQQWTIFQNKHQVVLAGDGMREACTLGTGNEGGMFADTGGRSRGMWSLPSPEAS